MSARLHRSGKVIRVSRSKLKQVRMISRERLLEAAKNYISDAVIILAALAFYRTNGYYAGFLRPETQAALFWIAAAYLIIALPFYVLFPFKKPHLSKGRVAISGLARLVRTGKMGGDEKIILLFILVKFFYIPLMLNFVFNNGFSLNADVGKFAVQPSIGDTFLSFIYPLALSLLFFIDTAFFTFGYLVEAGFLKNKVRSVEPTFLGWAVALLTYPPFNSVYNQFFPWVTGDYNAFASVHLTILLRIAVIVLVGIFVWATVSLGTKCSNLTNRGVVSRGPYKYVRHPAYVSKNLVWWITLLPVIAAGSILIMAAWSFLYYMRAVTEERHLNMDKDYHAYKEKVKYMFIPRVV